MLMGFGATNIVWAPQLADLLATEGDGGEPPMAVCVFDNRGVGRSSSPAGWKNYTTDIMAGDVLALMDHLAWQQFHLVGHSMGSMIASKVAALAPQRVLSLSLISGTGGRWQAVPQSAAALWLAVKMLFARSVHSRAAVDVRFHFRRKTLIKEYVDAYVREEQEHGQSTHNAWGQLGAVLRHRLRKRDVKSIQLGQFPILIIHGRQDVLALPKYGEKLAARLQAPCVMLEGGHFVIREQAAAVNALLRSVILDSCSWTNVERYPYRPFRHFVAVVEGHRQRAAKREAQYAAQQHSAQQAERLGHRLFNPWRMWRSGSRSLTPTEQAETELALACTGVSGHQQPLPQQAQPTSDQEAWQVGGAVVPPGGHQNSMPKNDINGLAAAAWDLSGGPVPAPDGQAGEPANADATLKTQAGPSAAAAEIQPSSSNGSAPAVRARYTEGGGATLRNRQNGGSSSDSEGTPNSNLKASLLQ
ncbi:hypothetical protein N2152v2_003077 [Parachlorella kessleri]